MTTNYSQAPVTDKVSGFLRITAHDSRHVVAGRQEPLADDGISIWAAMAEMSDSSLSRRRLLDGPRVKVTAPDRLGCVNLRIPSSGIRRGGAKNELLKFGCTLATVILPFVSSDSIC